MLPLFSSQLFPAKYPTNDASPKEPINHFTQNDMAKKHHSDDDSTVSVGETSRKRKYNQSFNTQDEDRPCHSELLDSVSTNSVPTNKPEITTPKSNDENASNQPPPSVLPFLEAQRMLHRFMFERGHATPIFPPMIQPNLNLLLYPQPGSVLGRLTATKENRAECEAIAHEISPTVDLGDREERDAEDAEEDCQEDSPEDLTIGHRSSAGNDDFPLLMNGGTEKNVGGCPASYVEQFKQVSQLYELSPDPNRKAWLDDWLAFMNKIGKPINRAPIMAKKVLDLYQLYHLVVSHGGIVEVINKKLWGDITSGLNLPKTITSAAFTLRMQYQKYLYEYECSQHHFSEQKELDAAVNANKRDGHRNTPNSVNSTKQKGYQTPRISTNFNSPESQNTYTNPMHAAVATVAAALSISPHFMTIPGGFNHIFQRKQSAEFTNAFYPQFFGTNRISDVHGSNLLTQDLNSFNDFDNLLNKTSENNNSCSAQPFFMINNQTNPNLANQDVHSCTDRKDDDDSNAEYDGDLHSSTNNISWETNSHASNRKRARLERTEEKQDQGETEIKEHSNKPRCQQQQQTSTNGSFEETGKSNTLNNLKIELINNTDMNSISVSMEVNGIYYSGVISAIDRKTTDQKQPQILHGKIN